MSDIVTCSCGTHVRLPKDRRVRSIRCPECKTPLALTVDARPIKLTPVTSAQQIVCSICRTNVTPDEECLTCPSCDQAYHLECWSEMGGCGTYGCKQSPPVDKSAAAVQAPLAAWGDTKRCPACGEKIKAIAVRCRYCNTDFQSVDPMSLADLKREIRTDDDAVNARKVIVGLFVASLIGCLAPLVAIASLAYVLPKRAVIARSGPLYVIMAWTALVLSCLYSVLILLFVLREAMS